MEAHAYPLLLAFGENSTLPEPAAALAAALPRLRDTAALAEAVQGVTLNLMCQLGGI